MTGAFGWQATTRSNRAINKALFFELGSDRLPETYSKF
jgi:hypothetical protein